MIFNIVGLIIGVLLAIAGIYYLSKEKDDADSRKIYMITTIIGVVVIAFILIRWFVL